MSIIRVDKNQNYTVMSNAHLRDKDLSLKAKGLLSVVLSLPDEWNYSLSGLASISKEGITAIRSAINELQEYGAEHISGKIIQDYELDLEKTSKLDDMIFASNRQSIGIKMEMLSDYIRMEKNMLSKLGEALL